MSLLDIAGAITGLTNTIDGTGKAADAYYACEQQRKERAWESSIMIAGLGLLQTVAYANEYSDVVNWRNEINTKLYNCAKKEHDQWRDITHPHMNRTYDYIDALPEITPDYVETVERGTMTKTQGFTNQAEALQEWVTNTDSGCHTCTPDCDNELVAENALGMVDTANQLMRHDEVRQRNRRELKATGQNIINRSQKNIGAPGRAAMELSLNMTNALVAMAASGLNSGMATLGQGMSGMSGNQHGGLG